MQSNMYLNIMMVLRGSLSTGQSTTEKILCTIGLFVSLLYAYCHILASVRDIVWSVRKCIDSAFKKFLKKQC